MLRKMVYFLENHDEDPAARSFGKEFQKAAAIVIATIRGTLFIQERQTKGYEEHLAIQRWVTEKTETPNITYDSTFLTFVIRSYGMSAVFNKN